LGRQASACKKSGSKNLQRSRYTVLGIIFLGSGGMGCGAAVADAPASWWLQHVASSKKKRQNGEGT
jgi:hypothetical protein